MPRRRSVPKGRLEIQIDEALKMKAELLFLRHDALTGKPAYGEWSRLVERLLNKEIAAVAPSPANISKES